MATAMAPHRPLTSVACDVHGHMGAAADQGRSALVQDDGGVGPAPRGELAGAELDAFGSLLG